MRNSDNTYSVIIFGNPDYINLKAEIKKLRTEISNLLLERDELRFVICKNIQTAYMLKFGALEYEVLNLYYSVERLKREIELNLICRNRQQPIEIKVITATLDEEFAEYQERLDDQMNNINTAFEYNNAEKLSGDETKELKHLYRQIVKSLHPDLNSDVTPSQLRLFNNAVTAYENGDLEAIRMISDMVNSQDNEHTKKNDLSELIKEKERLKTIIKALHNEIDNIKNEYPYTLKVFLDDPKKADEKIKELEATKEELIQLKAYYERQLHMPLKEWGI